MPPDRPPPQEVLLQLHSLPKLRELYPPFCPLHSLSRLVDFPPFTQIPFVTSAPLPFAPSSKQITSASSFSRPCSLKTPFQPSHRSLLRAKANGPGARLKQLSHSTPTPAPRSRDRKPQHFRQPHPSESPSSSQNSRHIHVPWPHDSPLSLFESSSLNGLAPFCFESLSLSMGLLPPLRQFLKIGPLSTCSIHIEHLPIAHVH